MPKRVRPEELSEEDLLFLLQEKRRKDRQMRLEEFRRTGRVVQLTRAPDTSPLEDLRGRTFEPAEDPEISDRERRRKLFFDRILLAVEVLAIIGLAFILLNGVGLIQELNQQVAAALVQPTLTPTPLISAVVLPSGHTPPTSEGGARFNEAEIPEHLRPLVQSLQNLVIPTPSAEQAVRIQIAGISPPVDAPVVQGDGWEELKKGVGQHLGSANPGDDGNLVLSAHNDIFGEIFRHLDELQPGDEIIVYSNIRSYTYVVTDTVIVDPLAVEVLDQTKNSTITLISCYPYLVNDQRIVVKGRLQQ
jgi:sortase A